ncbi:MAG: type II toxin-antitoxin system VapC family toxin [Candidatus Micrarchaeota archaeon]|nr:type II toxin-antitoxin system VapC family toxin [Candidatus Micrarchaeota archaeon]
MSEIVVDTSIIIDHLRNVPKATAIIEKIMDGSIIGYISVLTEAELFAGRDSGKSEERTLLIELLSVFNKIDVNESIARIAGDIRRKYGTSISDAIIAATSLTVQSKLVTQDIRDFERIKEISAEKPY